MKRRDFIKASAAAAGTAAVAGCGKKGDFKILSPVFDPPKGIIPGVPYYVKSTCTECPAGCGVDVKVLDGKALKLEGVVGHPVNDGRLCMRGQAFITRMYSGKRIKTPLEKQADGSYKPIGWEKAYEKLASEMKKASASGKQNHYLSGRTTGSLAGIKDRFCKALEISKAAEYEPFNYATLRRANEIVFGRAGIPAYNISKCGVLVTVGADIIQTFVSPVYHARQLAKAKGNPEFVWIHVEPGISLEGMRADLRLQVNPGSEHALLAYLYDQITNQSGKTTLQKAASETGLQEYRIQELVAILRKQSRPPLVIAGGVSTAGNNGLQTAVLAAMIQAATGSDASCVDFSRSQDWNRVGNLADIQTLAGKLDSGNVGVLLVSRCDPSGTLPSEIKFSDAMSKAGYRVAMADHMNDTARTCDLVLPLSHALESWDDAAPQAGILSIIQPAIEKPLADTKSEGQILLDLMTRAGIKGIPASYEAFLKSIWEKNAPVEEFRKKGFIALSSDSIAKGNAAKGADMLASLPASKNVSGNTLIFAPSIRFYDGRSRELALMNEIPDPLSTITYGEWVSVSEEKATSLGVKDGDIVRLSASGWMGEYPVKVQPRLSGNTLVIDRGLKSAIPPIAMTAAGEMLASVTGITVAKIGKSKKMPILSGSPSQEGRGIVPNPVHLKDDEHHHSGHDFHNMSLYPKREYKDYRWAMAIDLDKCTACGACVSACYVENNIPMTGEREHIIGREMSWIRIEPYYDKKDGADFIPMLCQQCNNAPCEPVCPVYAAYHTPEGLNGQIYNRCVGTRYCANNCPYKVRRFNWFDHKPEDYPLHLISNPDVSKRGRGIMEKCTFCVQRIRDAKDHAKDENRKVRDGEIQPACAQTCPSEAIVFGNILDENSKVSKASKSNRVHQILDLLGTQPAVYYLGGKSHEKEA